MTRELTSDDALDAVWGGSVPRAAAEAGSTTG